MSNKSLNRNEQLRVENLTVRFYTYEGIVKAVEKASLNVKKGETLGIVGETGSGKSVTALTIMALTPSPGRVEEGYILFRERENKVFDILKMSESHLLQIRGKEISMIFQEPNAALDPIYKVGDQVAEAILVHRLKEMVEKSIDSINKECGGKGFWNKIELWAYGGMLNNPLDIRLRIMQKIPIIRDIIKRRLNLVVRQEIIELLRLMEIADPERVIDAYPHELSGGMQQRIVIATALACSPLLLIADEPTTNLDVTIQAQILDLINRLKEKFGTSIIYITHDIGVVAEVSDRVAVMYAGSVVEVAPVKELFRNPLHPYTKGLLASVPRPGLPLKSIPGTVPNLNNPPSGCRFHPRCPYAMEKCREITPKLVEVAKDHYVACLLYESEIHE